MISTTNTPNSQCAHCVFQDVAMMSSDPSPHASEQIGVIATEEVAYMPVSDQQRRRPPPSRKAIPAKKVSVSHLAFPFHGRRKVVPPGPPSPPSPIPKPIAEPPLRRKQACGPSPLGPASARSPAAAMATPVGKTDGGYHGYSGHSFLLTKWVWSTRQAQFKARLSETSDHADDDLASDAALPKMQTSHPSYLRLRQMRCFYSEEKRPDQVPLTVYPRQGDIAALRNPYCARVDRSFATVPLWTLRKILCLYAILIPKPRPVHVTDSDDDAFEEAGSEVSFDAESTVVDSDSDWDASTTCSSRQDDDDVIDSSEAKGNLLELAVNRVTLPPDVSTGHMATPTWLCKFYLRPTFKFTSDREPQTWPSSWYGFWELLIELARQDGGRRAEASEKRLEVKVRPPKEFRWLKLLGGSRAPKPSPIAVPSYSAKVGSGAKRSPAVASSPGALRSSFLTPSHPAAG